MLALPPIPTTTNNSNMEMELSSLQQNHLPNVVINGQKAKRTKSPGIRVVGNRIYDSADGITCHQCRQKTREPAASCKNLKRGKPCVIKFCHRCLKNRYGEEVAEVQLLSNWKCPKCRGKCNCSCCRKRQGLEPTGPLVHTAKASGFNSVSDMLHGVVAQESLESDKVNNVAVSPMKEATLKKEQILGVDNSSCDRVLKSNAVSRVKLKPVASEELVVILSGEPGKENSLDEYSCLNLDSRDVQKIVPEISKKRKREGLKEISNGNSVDDACQYRSPKKPQICNEVPEEDSKRNANDGIMVLHEASEKETKVDRNHDIVYGEMDGPEKWAANDFFFNPMTLASKDSVPNPMTVGSNDSVFNPVTLAPRDYIISRNQYDVNGETYGKFWQDTSIIDDDDDDDNAGVKSQAGVANAPKVKNCTVDFEREKIQQEVPLSPGTMLTDISEIEFPPEDVGNALQFLEFCRVFGKVIDVKKGEAEAILRELVRKQNLRRGANPYKANTLVVQFHIRLLTVILIDSGQKSPSLTTTCGKNSWLKALEDSISGSGILKDFPLDWLREGIGGYYELDLSKKLSLLNFLCDEALGTEKLRNYIDDQNLIFAEEVKEAKSKVAAAKEKEKCLKQKLQDEVAKAIVPNGTVLSISEHDALLSKIKSEAARAHAEMLEAKGTIPKRKQSSDAVRTDPLLLDDSGHVFWQLRSYTAEYAVLMQDIKAQDVDGTAADERWFVYGSEKKDEIVKYISSRANGPKTHKVSYILPNESSAVNL